MNIQVGDVDVVRNDGCSGWCHEVYDKLWLNEGTILVVIDVSGYIEVFCPDDGWRYNLYRSEFEDFTIPIEQYDSSVTNQVIC